MAKKRVQNVKRSIQPEVFKDKKAENMLSFKKKEYAGVSKGNKTRNRAIDTGRVKPQKKQRTYTEKELGIPKLNTALQPVGVAVKGKKGKKFVTDAKMALILAEVTESSSAANASKLEKARQLEAIRESKRQEIEDKERAQKEKYEKKKGDLKKKGKKGKPAPEEREEKPRKRRVAFA